MSAVARAVLSSWSLPAGLTLCLVAFGLLYFRGWLRGWRRLQMPPGRLYATVGGLGALVLAIASPVDALAGFLLSAHMVQHLFLLAVAPPLLLLGAPTRVLLRALPPAVARDPLVSRGLLRVQHVMTPLVGVVAL